MGSVTRKGGKDSVYQAVTERIIERLQSGVIPWKCPYAAGLPGNMVSGKRYRGVNVWLLGMECEEHGYQHNQWLTYKQAKQLGGHVRKGQHGTKVVYWHWNDLDKPKDPNTEDTGKGKEKPRCWMREYTVFNVEQCEGLRVLPVDLVALGSLDQAEALADGYLDNGGPTLSRGASIPHYSPCSDSVHMPVDSAFSGNTEAYYAVLFHELVHSTGHGSRLDRNLLAGCFDTGSYSLEELVAELGASYLCALTGVNPEAGQLDNAASYIRGWIKYLGDDPRALVTAAARAQKAVDFMFDQAGLSADSPDTVTTGEPVPVAA